LLVCVLLVACGDESPGDAADAGQGDGAPLDQRYLPLAPGATWQWDVTDNDPVEPDPPYVKTSTVGALEDVGGAKAGQMAYKVTTVGDDGTTVSWQELSASAVRRHREQTFDLNNTLISDQVFNPHKLRIDERSDRIVAGATWTETYTEVENGGPSLPKVEQWTVLGVDVPCTTGSGETLSCLQVRRNGEDEGDSVKTYWFARGVGKVREEGKKTEVLKSYDLP
jgi:hypothetical protein